MDISMIVPCYKLEPYIKNLLLSFHMLNLNNIDYEIIFVIEENNGDNTYDIITEYMKDMNYQILFSNGGTVGLARNVGLDAAQGDYIWFLDGDDWIINPDVVRWSLEQFKESNDNIIKINFASNFYKRTHYSMVWQYIIKRSFIDDLRFVSNKHYEDNIFIQALLRDYAGKNITFLDVPSYFYNYQRPGSLMYNLERGIE